MARLRILRHLPLLLVLLVPGPGMAQSSRDDGVPVGPWLLSPYIESELDYDSNVAPLEEENQSDRITEVTAGLDARLPFRNSYLDLGYARSNTSYEKSDFAELEVAEDFELSLTFKMSTGDRLTVRAKHSRDSTTVRPEIDVEGPGSNLEADSFTGQPYRRNRIDARYERAIPDRQGFVIAIRRLDFNYEGTRDIRLHDYRGFDNTFEYRQPLPGGRWLVAHYNPRRFNFYRGGDRSTPEFEQLWDPVGVRFRKEESDSYQLGLMGELGEKQPFLIRLGYGSYLYDEIKPRNPQGSTEPGACPEDTVPAGLNCREITEVREVTGLAHWQLKLGDQTELGFDLSQRALPSSSDETYYVYSELQIKLERELGLRTALAVAGRIGRSRYESRDDEGLRFDVDFKWEVHPRFEFRIGASLLDQKSTETDNNLEYETNEFNIGIATGWF